ncbi:RNA polymerase sigma factor [Tellurirhabdus bombi]|uniref:hypothetical protein n=1 Tax=Tellurirhabdus bombi TaxID=2907205 RepID=UPI001F1C5B80|nr:hypothetical protein [Tellurirhabdus bombi]
MRLFVRHSTDEALIEGIRHGGTRRRFCEDRLYQKYVYFIHGGVLRHQLSEDDSASAYADAILTVIEKTCGGSFAGSSELKTDLYRTFANKCTDLLHQRTTSQSGFHQEDLRNDLLLPLPDEARAVVHQFMARQEVDILKTRLYRMSEKCRDQLLIWGEGISDDEIAQQMNYKTAALAKTSRLQCLAQLGTADKTEPTNDLATIDDYFADHLSVAERARLETRLQADPILAEKAAFYVQVRQIARSEARARRLAELDELRPRSRKRQLPIGIYASAIACLFLLASLGQWLSLRKTTTAEALANQFIEQHFDKLSNTLAVQSDSIQTGIRFFSAGKFTEAERIFSNLLEQAPDDENLLKLGGLVSLRAGNHAQAIACFDRLGQRSDSFANQEIFYEAITYLKQGQPNTKNTAKELLQRVIQENLEGKDEAERLLRKL